MRSDAPAETNRRQPHFSALFVILCPVLIICVVGGFVTFFRLEKDITAYLVEGKIAVVTATRSSSGGRPLLSNSLSNATECGWIDGDAVPIKLFGILTYSKRFSHMRRRLQVQGTVRGKIAIQKIGASGGDKTKNTGGMHVQTEESKQRSPIDRRGKSKRVDRYEYPDEPIHFSPTGGFRRFNATGNSVPMACRQQQNSRRRVLLHVPGNCHWGNVWHFVTECVHSVAHVMASNNITIDTDDVRLVMDVARDAGQLRRDQSFLTDWAGQYVNPCPRGMDQNPWNCSLDTEKEEKVQWWQIMYTPERLRRRALGLDYMELMLYPRAPFYEERESRLILYNSRTKTSDPPVDLLADVVISGTGRLDEPGLTHNNRPEAFAYARQRILAAIGINDEDAKIDTSKPKKALYISRKNAAQRKVQNERELIVMLKRVLSNAGYFLSIVHAEGISVEEQISLFQSSSLVVLERGAGMVNVLFLRNAALVYISNEGAHDEHVMSWVLPFTGFYKVFPVNGLPDCKNTDTSCSMIVPTVESALLNATAYLRGDDIL